MGKQRQLVVFLHGYGADGNDLIEIGRAWQPQLPQAAFVSPHAPQPCGQAPVGRQWFPLTFRDPNERWIGVNAAAPVLERFLDAELARHRLPPSALKNASGLYNLMRNLGGAVGLAMINAVATSRLAVHTLHLQEQVTWSRPGAMQFLTGLTQALTPSKGSAAGMAALEKVAMLVQQQALTLTYNDVLLLMAGAFFLALPLTFFLAKPSTGAAVEAH